MPEPDEYRTRSMLNPPDEMHEISKVESLKNLNDSEAFLLMTFGLSDGDPELIETSMHFSTGDMKVGQLLPAISHHLRELIATVYGWAQELDQGDTLDDDTIMKWLAIEGLMQDLDEDERAGS